MLKKATLLIPRFSVHRVALCLSEVIMGCKIHRSPGAQIVSSSSSVIAGLQGMIFQFHKHFFLKGTVEVSKVTHG